MEDKQDHRRLLAQATFILFWLQIASFFTAWIPGLSYVIAATEIVMLFRLQGIRPGFRTAALAGLADVAAGLLLRGVPEGICALLGTVLAQGLDLLKVYLLFTAYSAATRQIHESLAERWGSIRNGYLVVGVLTAVGVELFSYFTDLSSVILLAASVAGLAVEVLIADQYWKTYKAVKACVCKEE